ncbi:MAG: LysR substrate-binding domain-containing protein [Proteobacteria bacterium]|jgi:DNA-binding transcriptional LysR family regulator|nr:LysR substrate-binding domain-containing protein [Pseudomonadota bacterium]MDA0908031.1 LysR substrate-binding domain-containing protein [Pseudomonadota bacterium]
MTGRSHSINQRITLRQLEYVVAVGETGSITAASDKVNVSSPSISAAISQLEMDMGVQIFVRRHAQGLFLTSSGRRLFDEAKVILNKVQNLGAVADDTEGKLRGTLKLGCLITIAPILSANIRRRFEDIYPETEIILYEAHQADLLAMLDRAEIDVALTYDLGIGSNTVFVDVATLPPYVLLGANHPLAAASELAIEDLADQPMVLLDLPLSGDYFLSMFHRLGLTPQIGVRTKELPVLRSLVANGYGYGLLNVRTHAAVAPDGLPLVFTPLKGDHQPMQLGIAHKFMALPPRLVAEFIDHVAERASHADLPGIIMQVET